MRDDLAGPVCKPERLARTLLAVMAGSYALDGVLLAGFAWAGVIDAWVPLAYVATGLLCCAAFDFALRSGFATRRQDRSLALPRLAVAVAVAVAAIVQLSFVVLAPAVALYFIGALFIAFAALRLRLRQSVLAWLGCRSR